MRIFSGANLKHDVLSALFISSCMTVLMAGNVAAGEDGCSASDGQATLEVQVSNIRTLEGNIRAQVYGEDPEDFLAKGKKLVRVDVPVTGNEQSVCVSLPSPGSYALVVMHDKNANGKANFFTEGFGFSRNPDLNMAPPDHDEVVIQTPEGLTTTAVTLKYMFAVDEEKKKKRRRLRRR